MSRQEHREKWAMCEGPSLGLAEVNRPTFFRLQPPLRDACRYISFTTLRQRLPELERFAQYLKPNVLEELSESCTEEGD